jgi:uncharacterized protein (TIGR02147 family)
MHRMNNGHPRETKSDYLRLLKHALAKRCDQDPGYSLRTFARNVGISVSSISRILSGKQIPSFKHTQKICHTFAFDPAVRSLFVNSVVKAQRSRHLKRTSKLLKLVEKSIGESQKIALGSDQFRLIADWYHYAILELTFVPQFSRNPKWIASQLGIGVTEARLAMDRLLEEGLLMDKDGRLVKTNNFVMTRDKSSTSTALKLRQKQILQKSIASVELDPLEERSHMAMTMAIDPDLLPEAKKMMLAFSRKLTRMLEAKSRKRVYELSLSLFPLQKKESV